MMWNLVTLAILQWAVLAMLYMIWLVLLKRPARFIDDVPEFLRPVDLEQAEALLDPAADHELRWKLDASAFREVQRRRTHLYLELVGRMAHNARVLVDLGNREADKHPGDTAKALAIQALQQEAVSVRAYALFTILELRVLMLLGPHRMPALSRFRRVSSMDGIATYKALRQASTAMFAVFGRPVDKLTLNY